MKPIDVFKHEISGMAKELNMRDWDLTVTEGKINTDDEANVISSSQSRVASIIMSKSIKKDESYIRRVGRHESWHLFLANYRELARNRWTTEAELDREEERMCTVLEKFELV